MHRQYLHVEGRTIAYLDTAPSSPELPAAVFVHAFPLAATMWEAQLRAVPPGWRYLALDLRGFGGSTDADNATPSIDDYADDVASLVEELRLPNAVIGGASMGGYVTFAVLRRRPSIVRAVVLADTRATADTSEGRESRRSMLALVDREGPAAVAREMLPKLMSEHTRMHRPDVESSVRRLIKQQSPQAIRGAIMRLMSRPDATDLLPATTVPALIMVGEHDAITPVEESRRIAGALPAGRLVVIPNAGHLSSLEQPDAFNTELTSFLASL